MYEDNRNDTTDYLTITIVCLLVSGLTYLLSPTEDIEQACKKQTQHTYEACMIELR